jgi:precorrin-6A synthase
MKRRLLVIGIGAGDPDHLTVQAIKAMNRAQVFFIPEKGAEKDGLARIRREICEQFIENDTYRLVPFAMPVRRAAGDSYGAAVDDWHAAMADIYGRLLAHELDEDRVGAFLVWGDPMLYDSTLRILDRLKSQGGFDLAVEVVPGITAIQALVARHGIPLNAIGEPVLVTTGRQLRDGFPRDADSAVVMLDNGETLRAVAEDCDIWWGANIGLPEEMLVSGRLRDVVDRIEANRKETREKQGWVMDTYLLRRRK